MTRHCHAGGGKEEFGGGSSGRRIVLAGNPNVGKSVIFNYLAGTYVDVSNYPGTTIEVLTGRLGDDLLLDTPGAYGIGSFNDEERVTRDVVLSADLVVNVVNAVHLERDLFLTLHLIDMGIPLVVALNMMDEADRAGIRIDLDLLSHLLGVEVVPTVAAERKGLYDLKNALAHARPGIADHELDAEILLQLSRVGSRGEALLLLEGDAKVASDHGLTPLNERERIYLARRNRVNDIVSHVETSGTSKANFSNRLGLLLLHPVFGVLILAMVLLGVYELVGVLVAQNLVGLTEDVIMRGYWEPWISSMVSRFVPQGAVFTILAGEFGVLTHTVRYLLGLLLPLVFSFYLVLAFMEDSGYLPRLAVLSDRLLNSVGLNGRAVIPIILGFGCVTMGTITTRLLSTEREKSIATSILNFTIPCSAQIGVIAALLVSATNDSPYYLLVYLGVILACLVAVGTFLDRILPGKSADLLIDLPPMRFPRAENVARKTFIRTFAFMKEAFPLFFLGSFIVAGMQVTGLLKIWQDILAPVTRGFLGLPPETATAFVMGMVRRDFGAAGLYDMDLSAPQIVVSLVVITLFVPCIASTMILWKERGPREAVLIWCGTWVAAFLVGALTALLI